MLDSISEIKFFFLSLSLHLLLSSLDYEEIHLTFFSIFSGTSTYEETYSNTTFHALWNQNVFHPIHAYTWLQNLTYFYFYN